MAKCWRCGRGGYFTPIGRSGLCINCLEDASESALSILAELRKGGEARKKALALIDTETAKDVVEQAANELESSDFSMWDASVHASPDQLVRIKRSRSVKIINYDESRQEASIAGSGGTVYTTTLSSCSCGDFIARHLPCKHIYKLAALYGGVDLSKYLE